MPRHGLPRSYFYNPYNKACRKGEITLEESLEKYEAYLHRNLLTTDEGQRELEALRGKTLGCWCAGKHGAQMVVPTANGHLVCHGQILLRALEGKSGPPPPKEPDKEAAQQKAYEAFTAFGEKINNGGVLRSAWKAKALDMGLTGREFGTAVRQLEAAGRVEAREYADQKDRYYYAPRELGMS
jgi:hypothetical protein